MDATFFEQNKFNCVSVVISLLLCHEKVRYWTEKVMKNGFYRAGNKPVNVWNPWLKWA